MEPLLGERERKGLADPDSVLDALPYALFEALTQREWEREVVWAAEDADAVLNRVHYAEEVDAESADEQQQQPNLVVLPAPVLKANSGDLIAPTRVLVFFIWVLSDRA